MRPELKTKPRPLAKPVHLKLTQREAETLYRAAKAVYDGMGLFDLVYLRRGLKKLDRAIKAP